MPLTLADLPRFSPPYLLGGSVLIVLGRSPSGLRPAPSHSARNVPFLSKFCVFILNEYSTPPADLPLQYHELIASRLVLQGGALRSQPAAMILDAELPVELGHIHYGMPKRFDRTLHVRMDDSEGSCEGHTITLRWRTWRAILQGISLPLRVAATLTVRLFSHAVEVIGTEPNAQRARITLSPSQLGRMVSIEAANMDGTVWSPWFAIYFPHVVTELGPPHPLA